MVSPSTSDLDAGSSPWSASRGSQMARHSHSMGIGSVAVPSSSAWRTPTSGDSVTDRIVRVLETFTPTRTVQTAAEIGRRAGLPPLDGAPDRRRARRRRAARARRGPPRAHRHAPVGARHPVVARAAAAPGRDAVHGAGAGARPRAHAAGDPRAGRGALPRAPERPATRARTSPASPGGCPCTRRRRVSCCSRSATTTCRSASSRAAARRCTARRSRMPQPCAASSPRCARSATPSRRGYIEAVSTGVAVPVRDETGAVIAALSVRAAPRRPRSIPRSSSCTRAAREHRARAGLPPLTAGSIPFNGNPLHADGTSATATMVARQPVEGDAMTTTVRTRVAIVGAGPAGLLLSHLLARRRHRVGRRSTSAPATRSRRTIRAGILEQGTVEVLDALGRLDARAHRRAPPRRHRAALRGRGPPHRLRRASSAAASGCTRSTRCSRTSSPRASPTGQDLRFGVTAERVEDAETDAPARHRDGCRRRAARDRGRVRRRRRRVPQRRARRGDRLVDRRLLPRVPVRLVRHPVRSAAERARAHLQQLRRTASR